MNRFPSRPPIKAPLSTLTKSATPASRVQPEEEVVVVVVAVEILEKKTTTMDGSAASSLHNIVPAADHALGSTAASSLARAYSPAQCADVALVSTWLVYPSRKSAMGELKLSVSDLPMLSCNYIQKGLLFPKPPVPIQHLLSLLRVSLSRTLSHFPALAGRLVTHPDGGIFVSCNDAGVPFSHYTLAAATGPVGVPVLTLPQVTLAVSTADVPPAVKDFLFDLDGAVSYEGHIHPLAAVRVTELSDSSLFIGCTVNHAVADGTSFWNFFNSWAELCRGDGEGISRPPDFRRNFFGRSTAVLRFPDGKGPAVTFDADAPLSERIFRFNRVAVRHLKATANRRTSVESGGFTEISSFQSLCALLWRSVTRARRHKLAPDCTTTLRLAVNCRHRVDPPVDPLYFGNAIQSIPTAAPVGEVATRELRWVAALLHRSVAAYGQVRVREVVAEWERGPRCFPLGNPGGAVLTVGSSPRFPMYDGNDFGWGRPVAVRSGRANKFDGKVSAFPPADGEGGVELEVCLAPDTMAALVSDRDFMGFVSPP
ncbi:hypothetical protein Taro_009502 [Colocasia esculenta]|uniref:Uncharacterized protein n=1 Tax=Colocasia esculenta TaxID=4460 RepID=A0A843U6N2_COLES|nr:hypothetical protein [Colocasia esculenta]